MVNLQRSGINISVNPDHITHCIDVGDETEIYFDSRLNIIVDHPIDEIEGILSGKKKVKEDPKKDPKKELGNKLNK